MALYPRERAVGAMLGHLVGDALGVPVEFAPRAARVRDPVTGMRGFGTHQQPAGTFSDDGSLMLCTAESLLDGFDPAAMMGRYRAWLRQGYWSAHGTVFDIGNTTRGALERFEAGEPPERWGAGDERENGNGSLMRVLPVAIWGAGLPADELAARAAEASALTHAHPRSRLCCSLYVLVVQGLLQGGTVSASLTRAARLLSPQVPASEAGALARLLDGRALALGPEEVRSTGFVVHTLEAALWASARCLGFADTVLLAVNLGDDTDTVAAVTGSLAGALYGRAAIPPEWIDALARRQDVVELAERLAAASLGAA